MSRSVVVDSQWRRIVQRTARYWPTRASTLVQSHSGPEDPEASGAQGRFLELDAYRGIAALSIVVYHVYVYARDDAGRYLFEGTWLDLFLRILDSGVAWFFVLSGFVIFLPFARAVIKQRGAQPTRRFLIRRAIRILPVYYVAILIVWSLRYAGHPSQWIDLIEHLTFTHIFDQAHFFGTIGPAWSLGVEVVFYLFLAVTSPWAYRACSRLHTPRSRAVALTGGVAMLGIASLAYKWWAFTVARILPWENYPLYYGPLAQIDIFALGMLLAVVVASTEGRWALGSVAVALLRVTALTLFGGAALLRFANMYAFVYFNVLAGVAFTLIIASTVLGAPKSAWKQVLAYPALQFLGAISYSLYLWHEPVLAVLVWWRIVTPGMVAAFPFGMLVSVVLSIAVATISYRIVERPAMQLRSWFTWDGRFTGRERRAMQEHDGSQVAPCATERMS